jgi:tripartite-type tricarboxylate transporter receptor subunit TctC
MHRKLFFRRSHLGKLVAFAGRSRKIMSVPLLAGLLILASAGLAHAQADVRSFPNRPIHIIVGNAAGGGNDLLARMVGQKLSDRLGQSVVIENKPGASGALAAQQVAKSAADGHTLLMAPIGMLVVNPAVIPNLPYDPQRDFAPVSLVASFPLILTVNASIPIHSVQELVAYAKANPEKANAGGSGVIFQVTQKMFEMRTGTQFQYVTYRSNTETMVSLMRGDVLMSLSDAGPVAGPLKDGRVRALAVTAAQRLPAWPDVPTMAEAGLKDMEISFWSGLVAPAGTPQPVVKKLQDQLIEIMRLDDIRARMAAHEVTAVGSTSDEFAKLIAKDLPLWAAAAKAGNIRVQQ